MAVELPTTLVDCDGCGKELNVLNPYLYVMLKAQREVLISNPQGSPSESDLNAVAEPELYLGTRSGRGRMMRFHDFDCIDKYVNGKKGKRAKLEFHKEDGDPFVPDDNRSPEELVESGDLPKEFLAFHKAASKDGGSE